MRWRCLNEVQPPKKLQAGHPIAWSPASSHLNEVQFPKELQRVGVVAGPLRVVASMKCSSRKNCNQQGGQWEPVGNPPQRSAVPKGTATGIPAPPVPFPSQPQ